MSGPDGSSTKRTLLCAVRALGRSFLSLVTYRVRLAKADSRDLIFYKYELKTKAFRQALKAFLRIREIKWNFYSQST